MQKEAIVRELTSGGFLHTARYIHAIFKEARLLSQKFNVPQDYEDICQLALVEAVKLEKNYDKSRGTFLTFIRKPIRQSVQKVYGYSRSATKLYNKVGNFMEEYNKINGHYPALPVIAKALKKTEWDIKSIHYGKPYKVSLDALSEDHVLDNEQLQQDQRVLEILETLNQEDRTLVHEYYLQDYSMEELSAIYEVHPSTISNNLMRILQEVRKELNV